MSYAAPIANRRTAGRSEKSIGRVAKLLDAREKEKRPSKKIEILRFRVLGGWLADSQPHGLASEAYLSVRLRNSSTRATSGARSVLSTSALAIRTGSPKKKRS